MQIFFKMQRKDFSVVCTAARIQTWCYFLMVLYPQQLVSWVTVLTDRHFSSRLVDWSTAGARLRNMNNCDPSSVSSDCYFGFGSGHAEGGETLVCESQQPQGREDNLWPASASWAEVQTLIAQRWIYPVMPLTAAADFVSQFLIVFHFFTLSLHLQSWFSGSDTWMRLGDDCCQALQDTKLTGNRKQTSINVPSFVDTFHPLQSPPHSHLLLCVRELCHLNVNILLWQQLLKQLMLSRSISLRETNVCHVCSCDQTQFGKLKTKHLPVLTKKLSGSL